MTNNLDRLATLLTEMNSIGNRISEITQMPATSGHTGEYIASKIFDIELEESASLKGLAGAIEQKVTVCKWKTIDHRNFLGKNPYKFPENRGLAAFFF